MSSITVHGLDRGPFDTIGIGVFDGLHRAHQAILDHADTLLTFDPHPDIVLSKDSTLRYLSAIDELRHYVPNLLVLEFNNR